MKFHPHCSGLDQKLVLITAQEGQLLDVEELKKAMTTEQVLQIQYVCRGAWINKFTNDGKGPLHPRFFWINPSNSKVSIIMTYVYTDYFQCNNFSLLDLLEQI